MSPSQGRSSRQRLPCSSHRIRLSMGVRQPRRFQHSKETGNLQVQPRGPSSRARDKDHLWFGGNSLLRGAQIRREELNELAQSEHTFCQVPAQKTESVPQRPFGAHSRPPPLLPKGSQWPDFWQHGWAVFILGIMGSYSLGLVS